MSVLLVYDVDGWAWHNRAMDLQQFAPKRLEVEICSDQEANNRFKADSEYFRKFDAVFTFNWPGCHLKQLRTAKRLTALVTSSGLLYDGFQSENWDSWVYTPSRCGAQARDRLPRFDGIIAVNAEIAQKARESNPNTALIPSGINAELYKYEPTFYDSRPLHVGWCANPRGKKSVKGYAEVLQPLMASGIEGVRWIVNDRHISNAGGADERALTREEMVDWHHGIDVLLCTSINEGTPSPVFESASCGNAIVSTDVGCVRDWELPHHLGIIAQRYHNADTAERTISELRQIIQRYAAERPLVRAYGAALRRSIETEFSWSVLAERYFDMICGEPPW